MDLSGPGIRSSVGKLASPFRPLYKRISLLSLLLFFQVFPVFQDFSLHTLSFKAVFASYKPRCPILNFFDFMLYNKKLVST